MSLSEVHGKLVEGKRKVIAGSTTVFGASHTLEEMGTIFTAGDRYIGEREKVEGLITLLEGLMPKVDELSATFSSMKEPHQEAVDLIASATAGDRDEVSEKARRNTTDMAERIGYCVADLPQLKEDMASALQSLRDADGHIRHVALGVLNLQKHVRWHGHAAPYAHEAIDTLINRIET